MNEEWSKISELPNYEISTLGNLRNIKTNRVLKTRITREGYEAITLTTGGNKTFKSIHRLVAQAFIPNPDNKKEVNHIDEDKTNNHVSNLEWVTRKENINHGSWIERKIKNREKPIIASKDGVSIEFKSTKEFALKYGANPTNVTQALKVKNKNGTPKTIKGFTFKYKEV